ncbi:MAG: efflux RND transporter periplasmic adaptor subunit [Acidobacteriota bacterium]
MRDTIGSRKYVLLCGILLVGHWLSCGGPNRSSLDGDGQHESPAVHPRAAVAALGRVEPEDGFIQIATGLPDRVSSILVKEGDRVETNAALVVLESHDERQRARDLVRTQLAEAELRHRRESELARAQLAEAEASLDQARRLPPLDVEACRTEVDRLRIRKEEARKNLSRFDALAQRNSVSASEKERYEVAFQDSEKALEIALTRLQEAKERETTELSEAEHRVQTARAALAQAIDSSNIGELKKKLTLAETQLDQTIICAPSAGEVLQVFAKPGEASAGSPLLLLGDTSRLCVVAEVDESDAAFVRKAQRAQISSRALPEAIPGSVESVGHVILRNNLRDLDPAARADRRVVEVRIRLDDPQAARRFLNLQVDVEIITGPQK